MPKNFIARLHGLKTPRIKPSL